MLVKTTDGTPDAVKVARPVWSGGKSGDNFKGLPITISGDGNLRSNHGGGFGAFRVRLDPYRGTSRPSLGRGMISATGAAGSAFWKKKEAPFNVPQWAGDPVRALKGAAWYESPS